MREKHFLGIVYPHGADYSLKGKKRRSAALRKGHRVAEDSGNTLHQRALGFLRLGRFLGSLRREMLRMAFYGFCRPGMGTSEASFFDVTGLLSRAVDFRSGRARALKAQPPAPEAEAPVNDFYDAALTSLGFRRSSRSFFIGHIPFGSGTQGFKHLGAAYDFSLANLKLSGVSLWRTKPTFWLAGHSSKPGALAPQGKAKVSLGIRKVVRRWTRAKNRRQRDQMKKRAPRAVP